MLSGSWRRCSTIRRSPSATRSRRSTPTTSSRAEPAPAPPLLLGATCVGLLERVDRLIVERDRLAAVALFTHEVEPGRRLMAAQARHPLREIDDGVAAIADPGARLGDLQREKLPAVRPGEFFARMFHHGLERHELQDRADGIFRVPDAVSEDAHGLGQLLRIGVIDARISNLRPVQDAPKGLLRSEEHTSELQSRLHLVCRLLLEKKKNKLHISCTAPK